MKRAEIIQKLIDTINGQSYLEIGLGSGAAWKRIKCKKKCGVDPQFNKQFDYQKGQECTIKPTHNMTSDMFFEQNSDYFDVIFIDGLHTAEQVEKDIDNSLKTLNNGGFIVCHDMNPESEGAQAVPRTQTKWNGDCWKAWVNIRSERSDLSMFVVDTDHGCGVIQKGRQKLLDLNNLNLTYENLNKHRKEWLNLISVEEFIENLTL